MVLILCTLQAKKTMTTRNKAAMAFLTVEDKSGSIEIVVFPKVYAKTSNFFTADRVLLLAGKISLKEEEAPKLLCERVWDASEQLDTVFEEVADFLRKPMQGNKVPTSRVLWLKFENEGDPAVGKALEILGKFPGQDELILVFSDTGKRWKKHGVTASEAVINQLKLVINDQNIAVRSRI